MSISRHTRHRLAQEIACFVDAASSMLGHCTHVPAIRKASTTEHAIDAIARRLEPALRRRFLDAVKRASNRIDIEALARAIQANQLTQAEMATKLREWPETYGGLAIDLRAGFLAGGALAYEVIDGSAFKLRFDLINPHAVSYATQHMPKITQSYVAGAKEMIADITRQAVSGKYTPRDAAKLIKDYIGLTPQYATAVENYKAALIGDGISGERLDTKVARYTDKLLKARATTIARTEIIQAEVEGQRALWNEAAKEGMFDRRTSTRTWHVAQDERLCQLCAPMEGQEIPYNGTYEQEELGSVNVFGEPLTGPPLHPQCAVGYQPVEGNVIAATRMSYAGKIWEIVTASGRTLTITPNHPIATLRGFVPACQVKEGEYLLAYEQGIKIDSIATQSSPFSVSIVNSPQDEHHGPSTIEQVFGTLELSRKVLTAHRVGDEFHGDATAGNGHIDIIYVDSELGNRVEAALLDQCQCLRLKSSDHPPMSITHKADSDSLFVDGSIDKASPPSIGTLWPVYNPPDTRRIGSTAHLDAMLIEMASQFASRDASFFRELQDRMPSLVSQDQIVEIRNRDYVGHVYDLQTISGVIVADGLIISNCRCYEELNMEGG